MGSQNPGLELWGYPDVFQEYIKEFIKYIKDILYLSLLGHTMQCWRQHASHSLSFDTALLLESCHPDVEGWCGLWRMGLSLSRHQLLKGAWCLGDRAYFCPRVFGAYWMSNEIAFSVECAELIVFGFLVSQNQKYKHPHQDKRGMSRFSTSI